MTCIVGLVENGEVYIGGDSAGISGLDYSVREDKKVFENGEFIFGFTSSFRMGQLLRYSLTIPEQHPNEDDDYKFLVTTFIDAVKSCLKTNGFGKEHSGQASGGTFLIGYRGHPYSVYDDYQICESKKPYASVGCGESYALGAMMVVNDEKLSPEKKILKVLDVVQQFSAGVTEPFNIITCKGNEDG